MHRSLLSALAALTVLGSAALAQPAVAAGLEVDIELPRIDVADYRRPYVAVWLERADHGVAANLAVWYAERMRDSEGAKWLKDLRQWWRRSGRELSLPVDGLTSATRNPGRHSLSFNAGQAPLGDLAPGEYRLVVEAAREHGGREVLSLPLQWPPAAAARNEIRGKHEITAVSVQLKP